MPLSDPEIKNLKGLSQNQAEAMLKNEGYNELPSEKNKRAWRIIFDIIKEPMVLLLLTASAIYFLLGDKGEAWLLFGCIFVIIGITIYQENKTEKALSALRSLASPRAMVMRDGIKKIISGREVVRGDYLILREGDRVSADGIILWSLNLFIDESILTGESLAVEKSADAKEAKSKSLTVPGSALAYSGSLVTSGQGIMLVKKIGAETEMGKIGKMLNIIKPESTPLQKDIGNIVKKVSFVGLILCALVVFFYTVKFGGLINGFLAGLTLAMSILPEELPIIMAIFLSLGAWRISKKKVLARKISAVETLGSTSALCVDKTGTLTENKMKVEKIFLRSKTDKNSWAGRFLRSNENDKIKKTDNSLIALAEVSCLACKKQTYDPMETAIKEFGANTSKENKNLEKNLLLLREYPLSHKLLALANAWQDSNGRITVSAKGAPEAIFELCRLNQKETAKLMAAVKRMARENLRILGVARASYGGLDLPKKMTDFKFEFLGLIGLADPIRESVPLAVQECYEAGIKIIMITGDYPETALNIAKQIGLKNSEETISGEEFDMMSDEELYKRLKTVTVFSRMIPGQKLRLVEALKKEGEIVAMTGDGVNDAPALKSAHIGIAMGERGTDVSREASAIVLLNDNFVSLVQGIKVGRRVFDNLKKAIAYVLSIHLPIAGITLIPIIFNWPLILFPAHIVFLELITDPACSILFEAEGAEKNIMKRPPRGRSAALLDKKLLALSLAQGFIILLALIITYEMAVYLGKSENQVRALTFSALIFSNIFLILSNRSWTETIIRPWSKKNPTLWWITGGTIALLLMIIYLPSLNNIFKFSPLELTDLFLAFAIGLATISWHELYKLFKS